MGRSQTGSKGRAKRRADAKVKKPKKSAADKAREVLQQEKSRREEACMAEIRRILERYNAKLVTHETRIDGQLASVNVMVQVNPVGEDPSPPIEEKEKT